MNPVFSDPRSKEAPLAYMQFAGTALVLLASFSAFGQDALTASELRDWYAGASVEGHTEKGVPFKAYHHPDGRISAILGDQNKNSGTWKIVEPGQVCVDWENTSWGQNPCYVVIKDGDSWKIQRPGDATRFTRVRRLEGNAFGL